mmetsp:Transcript_54105/g.171658  ORF Transcript_54105/g.171658 Transcript_54105/m.171658 type:complete len:135 (+) Transcript_54105:168-572(+)
MEKLQRGLEDAERIGGDVVIVRERMVECDRLRQANREGLSVLRKGGVEAGKPSREVGEDEKQWVLRPGGVFVRLPHKKAISALTRDQKGLDEEIRSLEKVVKEKAQQLGEAGALHDTVGPGMLGAFLHLQDTQQ